MIPSRNISVLLLLICNLLFYQSYAQTTEWAISFGGEDTEDLIDFTFVNHVMDEEDNLYLTGSFFGSVDFDPGPGSFVIDGNGNDIFIVKFDSDGNFVWANSIGSEGHDEGLGIAIDSENNVVITGILNQNDESTLIISKFANSGNHDWTKEIGNQKSYNGIAIDDNDNIYITCSFQEQIDVDPGTGEHLISPVGAADMYLLKLNNAGEFQWVKTFGGTGSVLFGYSLKIVNGNIYSQGYFTGTVDMDPSAEINNLVANNATDFYLLKLDINGNFLNAIHLFDRTFFENDAVISFDVDPVGNIYLTGLFDGALDIHPGEDEYFITSNGEVDAFVEKLSPEGDLLWVNTYGSEKYDDGLSMDLDSDNNPLITGRFSNTVNFGTEEDEELITSSRNENGSLFILKLDPEGNLQWVTENGYSYGSSTYSYSEEHIHSSGFFLGTVNFESPDIDPLTAIGEYDIFIQKLSQEDNDNGGSNQDPEVINPIEKIQLNLGFNSHEIDISDVFYDPDMDELTYTATSSNESNLTVDVSDQLLVLSEIGIGDVEITLTANDGNEGEVSTTFMVEIIAESNSDPIVDNPISDKDLNEGFEELEIDLSEVFSDPDDDNLNFSATSNEESVISVDVSETILTIIESGLGKAEITVMASDGNGGNTDHKFEVKVIEEGNSDPTVITPISDKELSKGFEELKIDLLEIFSDPDDDNLSFSASSSEELVISVNISENILTITELGLGEAEVTITASDGNGGEKSHTFKVEVFEKGNSSPKLIKPIPDMELMEGFTSIQIDLDTVFTDSDGDELTFTFSLFGNEATSLSLDQSILTISEKGLGTSTITLNANDNQGGQGSDEFEITVVEDPEKEITSLEDNDEPKLKIYPNPAQDILTIEINDSSIKSNVIQIEAFDLTGKKCLGKSVSDSNKYEINLSHMNSGIYLLKISSIKDILIEQIQIH